jgi:S1-C subfamily serine protease
MRTIRQLSRLIRIAAFLLLAFPAVVGGQETNIPSKPTTNKWGDLPIGPNMGQDTKAPDVARVMQPREIAEKILPSTVLLVMRDANSEPLALGSGFIVGEGKVVSNFHVIEGATAGVAKLVGTKGNVEIMGVLAKNEEMDLVLLSVPGITGNAVTLSWSKMIAIGDPVYACGNPIGLEGTFSSGIVSGFRDAGSNRLLQITSPISPGSSGGPVANQYGAVVGVTVATFKGGQNLNLAIPANFVNDLLNAHQELQVLAKVAKATPAKNLFSNLGTENAISGIVGESFLWSGVLWNGSVITSDNSGFFSFSLRNRTKQTVKNITGLAIIYNRDGSPADFHEFTFRQQLPPGLAKRLDCEFEPSVKPLTTPLSREMNTFYSQNPSTKVEFRVMSFDVEE